MTSVDNLEHLDLTKMPIDQLLKLDTVEAIAECHKRDVLREEQGGTITVTQASVDDASLYLLSQYMQECDVDESKIGLANWLKIQSFNLIQESQEDFANHNVNTIQLKSRGLYWTFSISKRGKPPTLLGVKFKAEDDVSFFRDLNKPRIKLHVFNRLTTRALDIYISQGLAFGMCISDFIFKIYFQAKVVSKIGNKYKLRYDQDFLLNFIVIKTPQENKLITVMI